MERKEEDLLFPPRNTSERPALHESGLFYLSWRELLATWDTHVSQVGTEVAPKETQCLCRWSEGSRGDKTGPGIERDHLAN